MGRLLVDPRFLHGEPDVRKISQSSRVLTATIGSGDFISFPELWPHCVATWEASLGLSGYTTAPAKKPLAGSEGLLLLPPCGAVEEG